MYHIIIIHLCAGNFYTERVAECSNYWDALAMLRKCATDRGFTLRVPDTTIIGEFYNAPDGASMVVVP